MQQMQRMERMQKLVYKTLAISCPHIIRSDVLYFLPTGQSYHIAAPGSRGVYSRNPILCLSPDLVLAAWCKAV